LSRRIQPEGIPFRKGLIRSVGEQIDIPQGRKDDFQREIMNYIGSFRTSEEAGEQRISDRNNVGCRFSLFLTIPP
jgi:serine protein kinase